MTSSSHKLIHDFEMSFCGYSGSGKTTIVTQLIEFLSPYYAIGFLKHDAHRFQMDREGKDTYRAKAMGAQTIEINSAEDYATLGPISDLTFQRPYTFLDCDFCLIEGYKKSLGQKMIVLGTGETKDKILHDLDNGKLSHVVGVVGRKESDYQGDLPFFTSNQIDEIAQFVLNIFNKKVKNRPLYGLVLAGGKSTRMGQDKGQLRYHGVSQTEYLYQILSTSCDRTFISCRQEQEGEVHLNSFERIQDRMINFGPMGGIISAMETHPDARWLVIACDLPFVQESTVRELVNQSTGLKVATCFVNPEKGWNEPLCTLYEPKSLMRFYQSLGLGKKCPRKILMNSAVTQIQGVESRAVDNINTPGEYQQALAKIRECHEN